MKKYFLFKQIKNNMRDSHFETNLPHANYEIEVTLIAT